MESDNNLIKAVEKCCRHPSSHLPCYQTSGTGTFHICQFGLRPERRNLDVCLERYKAALDQRKDDDQ